MKIVSAILVLLVLAAVAWFFRYEHLAPVTYTEPPRYPSDPPYRAIVVCKVDRWTSYTRCDRVEVDAVANVAEMERWLKEQKKK